MILVNSAWDDPERYVAIVDLSEERFTVTPLFELDQGGWDFNKIRKFEWTDGGLNLTLYTEKDVSNEVRDISKSIKVDTVGTVDTNDSALSDEIRQIASANQMATARLKTKYDIVYCDLSPGILAGCYVSFNIRNYRYQPGGPLKEI